MRKYSKIKYFILDIGINMFILHSFGMSAIRILGPFQFITFYLGASVVSNLVSHSYWKFIHPKLGVKSYYNQRNPGNSLGASGAINAVSSVFALTYPKASLLIMGIVPVPALYAVGAFFAYDTYRAYTAGPNNSVLMIDFNEFLFLD